MANLLVEGSQATIVWHVDDAKISHASPRVVTWILEEIEKWFGTLSVTRGKKHVYVGMTFEMKGDGSVDITAEDYIAEAIQEFGEDVSSGATTPATNDLFIV